MKANKKENAMGKIEAFASTVGKFNCRADERVYRFTMDGCDEETGDVDTSRWYGLLRGKILGLAKAGAIISCDSQGFVDVEYFDDAVNLEAAWVDCEQETQEDEL
jgi:hypothetical protein